MRPLLDLSLTPNRPLDRRHARWLLAAIAAVFVLGGLRFALIGAWPVIPFLVIDAALLGWALAASYRSGRARETLRLDDAGLVLTQVSARGTEYRVRLEPWTARAELERLPTRSNRLWLTGGGRREAVGGFLSPREREQIHRLIGEALARWRRAERS